MNLDILVQWGVKTLAFAGQTRTPAREISISLIASQIGLAARLRRQIGQMVGRLDGDRTNTGVHTDKWRLCGRGGNFDSPASSTQRFRVL